MNTQHTQESCKGLGSVTLKKKQSTYTLRSITGGLGGNLVHDTTTRRSAAVGNTWAGWGVAARRATRPNGEWGYSTHRHMLGHERQEAMSPGRGVVLTDLQSSIWLSKTSLSLSLSLVVPHWPGSWLMLSCQFTPKPPDPARTTRRHGAA